MQWTIHPMRLGTLRLCKASQIRLYGYDQYVNGPCTSWLLRSGEHIVVVDSGPCSVEWGAKYHKNLSREPRENIKDALAAYGIRPEDVPILINTHLHWDHCWGNAELPNAKIYVQAEELRYAVAPLPGDIRAYDADTGVMIIAPWYDRVVPVEGDLQLLPGLSLVFTPGHSPGGQSVCVETAKGPQLIAGDTVGLYEALEFEIPKVSGLYTDLKVYYETLDKMLRISRHILPGHDPRVFEQDFNSPE